MSTDFSARLARIKPSPSMAAKMRVDSHRAAGKKIIDFTLGEPDLPTPPHIVASGAAALAYGKTRCTASTGLPSLRVGIAAKLQRDNGLAYLPDETVVGSGDKILIFLALAATLDDGDEVIVPSPFWVSYPDIRRLQGGVPMIVECDSAVGYKLGPAALERAITPRTKWLVLNGPNNPTGAVYDKNESAALADVLRRHPHVRVMTDEIYEHLVYGSTAHHSIVALASDLKVRTLIVTCMSKAYGMTGWRVRSRRAAAADQGHRHAAVAEHLVRSFPEPGSRGHGAEQRPRLRQRHGRSFHATSGMHARVIRNDSDVVLYLLDKAHVAAIDGRSSGAPNHIRLSFACAMNEIVAGCEALQAAVAELHIPSTTKKSENHHA